MDFGSQDHRALLQGIWNEIKTLHQSLGRRIDESTERLDRRIDETNARLDQNTARLDHNTARLDRYNARLDQNTARLGVVDATLRELADQQVVLTRYVKAVVERHDAALELLDERVTRLESDRPPHPAP